MRKTGVLLAVSSLPSKYGVGVFGNEAKRFIDYLVDSGCKIWQILPLNPLGYGNSPYQPYSSKAMDEIYIDLDDLVNDGLLELTNETINSSIRVDYQQTREYKTKQLKQAFQKFETNDCYQKFIKQEWVFEYAVFISLKKKNNLLPWYEWDETESNWIVDRQLNLDDLMEDIEYEMFVQYYLLKQWLNIKEYAMKKDIQIMGDIPFYVGFDSLDAWANQRCFLLDENKCPTHIAGVPPDYFSETGQRWGNPIYDWDYLKKTNFAFWIDRMKYVGNLFDIIRIDHFRAFDTYWKIPVECETAIEGEWMESPGYDFFNELVKTYPQIEIVAEDLGLPRKEVYDLRDYFGFKGMKIVQFAFDPNETNNNFDDRQNMIIYTGTHDNQTIQDWFENLKIEDQQKIKELFSEKNYDCENISDVFCKYTLSSIAEIAILPVQDILGLGGDSRMNTPGTIGSPNWEWKLSDFVQLEKKFIDLKKWNKTYSR